VGPKYIFKIISSVLNELYVQVPSTLKKQVPIETCAVLVASQIIKILFELLVFFYLVRTSFASGDLHIANLLWRTCRVSRIEVAISP
jgi:hypothetical protein